MLAGPPARLCMLRAPRGGKGERTVDRCSLDSCGGGTYGTALPGLSSIPQNMVVAAVVRL
jgi:hypothetical protein